MSGQIINFLKKAWHFLWEEDSWLSWVANLVLAFVLIKFIIYPGLGWMLGTSYPVVAVVSGSMGHDGNFETWWQSQAYCQGICMQADWYVTQGITKDEFLLYTFKNGFNKGDIMVLKGREPKNIKRGDVLVFQKDNRHEPIIHRVVSIKETDSVRVFQTKGDHNLASGTIDINIQEQHLLGVAVFRIPFLGWVKIIFVEFVNLFVY